MSLCEVPTWNLLLLYKTSGEELPLLVSCCLSSFLLIPEASVVHSCPEDENNTGPKWHIAEAANIHALWQLLNAVRLEFGIPKDPLLNSTQEIKGTYI